MRQLRNKFDCLFMEQSDDLSFLLSYARYKAFTVPQRNFYVMFNPAYQGSSLEKHLSVCEFFVVVHFSDVERSKVCGSGSLGRYRSALILSFAKSRV